MIWHQFIRTLCWSQQQNWTQSTQSTNLICKIQIFDSSNINYAYSNPLHPQWNSWSW
jgi:hypothetical protein